MDSPKGTVRLKRMTNEVHWVQGQRLGEVTLLLENCPLTEACSGILLLCILSLDLAIWLIPFDILVVQFLAEREKTNVENEWVAVNFLACQVGYYIDVILCCLFLWNYIKDSV